MMKKLIILIITTVFLVGCQSSKKINYYELNCNSTISEYIPLSLNGQDYYIPDFKEKSWESVKLDKNECMTRRNDDAQATMYIFRNIHPTNENFEDNMTFFELENALKKIEKKYIDIQYAKEHDKINFVNGIKFYDSKGKCKINDKDFYYCSLKFQSKMIIDSVCDMNVPTHILIIYENKQDKRNVENSMNEIKEWLLRTDY